MVDRKSAASPRSGTDSYPRRYTSSYFTDRHSRSTNTLSRYRYRPPSAFLSFGPSSRAVGIQLDVRNSTLFARRWQPAVAGSDVPLGRGQ